jgi:SAM-dependent methyltransferase
VRYIKAWQGEDGIRNVIPRAGRNSEFPEMPSFHPGIVLEEIIKGRPVCEVGCGYGRLAGSFNFDSYIGVDINVDAITRAKNTFPAHSFHVIHEYRYPPSMTKFAYTVCMHVPDDEYPLMIEAMCESTGDQIVIAEILGEHLRKPITRTFNGAVSHATFGRSQIAHENEFMKNGWSLVTYHQRPYPGKGTFTFLDFRKGFDNAA